MSAVQALLRAALELDGNVMQRLGMIAELVKRYRAHEITKDDFVETVCEAIEGKRHDAESR